jgi:glycosyltransferase involved in cell wall biosynthesis
MNAASPGPADVKVSVTMLTYNHERFIAQAIEGVLMQQTDFKVELLIGEDCSTDGTRAIVRRYGERYPEQIRLLLPESNLGAYANAIGVLRACRGQYIAYCEGDDYWTSKDKLQKQAAFLDSQPDCAMCFHKAIVFHEDGSREPAYLPWTDQKEISTLQDHLIANVIPTCSVMYRRGLIGGLPASARKLKFSDWVSNLLLAQHGKIGYINEVMAAYRIHPGGSWSKLSPAERFQANLEFYSGINAYLNSQYEITLGSVVSKRWGEFATSRVEQASAQGSVRSAIDDLLGVYKHWSTEPSLPSAWKTDAYREIWPIVFFASHQARDFLGVRYSWPRMVWSNPAWLRNRGVWSIATEAFLGWRVARLLRSAGKLSSLKLRSN